MIIVETKQGDVKLTGQKESIYRRLRLHGTTPTSGLQKPDIGGNTPLVRIGEMQDKGIPIKKVPPAKPGGECSWRLTEVEGE